MPITPLKYRIWPQFSLVPNEFTISQVKEVMNIPLTVVVFIVCNSIHSTLKI